MALCVRLTKIFYIIIKYTLLKILESIYINEFIDVFSKRATFSTGSRKS